ncbi:hypothetical protein QBC39DRAFT_70180 [Podospora conica]|nr:hypothetical protein QBC39DRAFT_70180 [Schizothecium conicum]
MRRRHRRPPWAAFGTRQLQTPFQRVVGGGCRARRVRPCWKLGGHQANLSVVGCDQLPPSPESGHARGSFRHPTRGNPGINKLVSLDLCWQCRSGTAFACLGDERHLELTRHRTNTVKTTNRPESEMQEVGDSRLGVVSRDIITTSLRPLPRPPLPPLMMGRLGSQENDGLKLRVLLTYQLGYMLPLDCSVVRTLTAAPRYELSLVVLVLGAVVAARILFTPPSCVLPFP